MFDRQTPGAFRASLSSSLPWLIDIILAVLLLVGLPVGAVFLMGVYGGK